jgi:hypothetical protein
MGGLHRLARQNQPPPGLYVTFLKENLAPPASFETSRKRRLKEQETTSVSADSKDEEAILSAYADYRNREIDNYIAAQSGEYQDCYQAKLLETQSKFSGFSEWKSDLAEKFVSSLARAELAKRISVENLETFRQRRRVFKLPEYLLALPAPHQGSSSLRSTDHIDADGFLTV